MNTIPDYKFVKKIYESKNSLVYRAIQSSNKGFVIVKILKENYPNPSELTRYKQEYDITNSLRSDSIIRAYDLRRYENTLAMLLEDFGGESLGFLISKQHQKFTIEEFLQISIKIVEGLEFIHSNNIIHKDINPSNIVYNPQTKKLKIIDFGIATRLLRENQLIRNPSQLEGTLLYISPEQTGRMNRGIDYRTDFYSLGITLYELLTHRLPFESDDPMELIHCHIAQAPVTPHHLIPSIPLMVSKIIIKLLEKTPEERYQSAWGLKADLEICLNQICNRGDIAEFSLQEQDICDRFHIPEKLYGREKEITQLLSIFERVSQGNAELVLVSGYSGIGKSALVNEVQKPIARQRGYFIAGKFDQFRRDIPYAAFSQAFQDLIQQLLTESETRLQNWRKQILEALGTNGQVIIDVIPDLEKIIGRQPSVSLLEPTENQNRFNLLFQRFINVFTQQKHPLAIFLDDLQWADLPSLKLIDVLMISLKNQYLLTIGAYRDNEVNITHPLMQTIEQLEKNRIAIHKIFLQPLETESINQLISDTLNCSIQKANPLSKLIISKTHGNPFFITQLLQSLYKDNYLFFERNIGNWQWNIQEIEKIGISENVVDLMIKKIEKLPQNTQLVLQLASCIGDKFNLELLSFVNQKSQATTAKELQLALQEGLILPLSNNYQFPLIGNPEELSDSLADSIFYKFLHDRVQQAAYTLIPEHEKNKIHLKIGRIFLQSTQDNELQETIFDVVNQLNKGSELIIEQSEKNELAQLNLQAGQKAKISTAYEPALKYLETGIKLLDQNSWKNQYKLTLNLYEETVETLYLTTNFERAEELSAIVLKQANEVLDRVKVYQINVILYYTKLQHKKSIDIAIEALKELGIDISHNSKGIEESIKQEQESIQLFLKERNIKDLDSLPRMTDPYKLAALSILQQIMGATIVTDFFLHVQVVLIQLNLCFHYGNSPQAVCPYSFYASFLCKGMNFINLIRDINLGYEFGHLSIKLLEKFEVFNLEALVMHMFFGFTWHWKRHLRERGSLDKLLGAFQKSLDSGENEFAVYASVSFTLIKLYGGYHLDKVEKDIYRFIKVTEALKQEHNFFAFTIFHNTVLNLIESPTNKLVFLCVVGKNQEQEEKYLKQWQDDAWLLFFVYHFKTVYYYLFNDCVNALTNGIKTEQHIENLSSHITVPQHYFYCTLSLLANYSHSKSREEKQNIIETVNRNQLEMQIWAEHCPENFQHKYNLIEAEKKRVLEDYWQAAELYEKAIQGAKKYEFIHEEAIAYERAAEFYFSLDRQEIGNLYLRNAHHCYSCWGAKAKVRQLEEEYPQLLVKTAPPKSKIASDTISTTGSDTSESFDLNTVIKASQALAGEIQLNKLLEKLMTIAIENAGAQKGLLILKRDNNWVIEAQRTLNSQETTTLQSIPIHSPNSNQPLLLSPAIANYVIHSKETVLLNDAVNEGKYIRDPYIVANQPKSILCTPLINQGKLSGILYLENNLTTNAFTSDRVELLRTLSAQAAISIENARLYHRLEDYNRTLEQQVAERTEQLRHNNEELAQTLQELKTTQNELIQSEKMAALGQLIAGIAHEINTPLGAIRAAIGNTDKALQASLSQIPQLLPQLNPQQQTDFFRFLGQSLHSQATSLSTREKRQIKRSLTQQLQSHDIANAQQLAHLLTEGGLHDNIESQLSLLQTPQAYQIVQIAYDIARLYANSQNINNAVERAAKIVFALKSYARYDHSGEKKSFQITDGIETVLELYQNYFKKGVEVVRRYQPVPEIPGYPDELVQVWTNLIHNAIQAMEGKGIIEIGVREQEQDLVVEVTDSGCGIPPEIQDKIFQPFFTTKPAGEGSGLGLDIVQKIIEKHQGTITFASVPGHTTFTVMLPRQ